MEPPGTYLTDILIIAFSLLAVAVLSSAESSLISVSKIRIRSLMDSGNRRAIAVQKILDQHDRLFSAVILTGNLFTVLATSIGTAMCIRLFGAETGIIAATIAMTYLTVVFGELTPKTFAVTYSEKLALFFSRPLLIYIKVIYPLIWIFHKSAELILNTLGVKDKPAVPVVTEEEIKAMIDIGEQEGAIERDEKDLLKRVFEFGDTEVSEAMVPRTEMITISSEETVTNALKLVSDHGYSRYPVYKENIDNIQGILYIKDILSMMAETSVDGLSVQNLMRDAFYIPENKMVMELLEDMRKKSVHIAVVMDEYGGTAGIVTLEDVMEEIVGALEDEFEAVESEKQVEIIDENTVIIAGQTPLDEIEMINGDLKNEDFNTIGGYVFGLFGRLPKVGEKAISDDYSFVIIEMDDKKISKIKLTKLV